MRAHLHGAIEACLLPVVVEELLGKRVTTLVDRYGVVYEREEGCVVG